MRFFFFDDLCIQNFDLLLLSEMTSFNSAFRKHFVASSKSTSGKKGTVM